MGGKRRTGTTITDEELLELILSDVIFVRNTNVYKKNIKLIQYTKVRKYHVSDRKYIRIEHETRRREITVAKLIWMYNTKSLVPRNFEVHHEDLDEANDNWDNLICLHKLDHRKIHAKQAEEVPF